MGRNTAISWTDATFNPWWGCTKVSPGCDNCYAQVFDNRLGGGHWGKGAPRRIFSDKHWSQLGKWQTEAKASGAPIKVFCASMADVMDDEAPEGQLDRLYEQINACPDLIFQLLTKRPHRYADRLPVSGFVHRNVRLGATCEDQHFYDVRWPILHRIASAQGLISWISYEPALGPLTIKRHVTAPDWIIFGGETGSETQRRPMEQSWAENLMDECAGTGTRFFMKQMSATNPRLAAELIPAHLLIRDFPGYDGPVGLRTREFGTRTV
jgi:protein gp37